MSTSINWSFLITSILAEKTVVFVGPGIDMKDGLTKQSESLKKFQSEYSDHVVQYHKQDNLLIFKNEQSKVFAKSMLKDYYKPTTNNGLIEQLAKIPLHLYISLSPDIGLKEEFERKNFAYTYGFYDVNTCHELTDVPTKSVPLLYDFLGTCENENTFVVSHQEVFALLKGISGSSKPPATLRRYFTREKTNNLIFLGVEFDKWYFQYLLNLLELDASMRYSMSGNFTDETRTLCFNDFQINFVSDDVSLFVKMLYQKFQDHQLREVQVPGQRPKRYIREKIVQLLRASFGAPEWATFCLNYYPEIMDKFTLDQSREIQINFVIDECFNRASLGVLLLQIETANSAQFENFKPYFD